MKNSFKEISIAKIRYVNMLNSPEVSDRFDKCVVLTSAHIKTLLKLKLHHPRSTIIFITSSIKLTHQICLKAD